MGGTGKELGIELWRICHYIYHVAMEMAEGYTPHQNSTWFMGIYTAKTKGLFQHSHGYPSCSFPNVQFCTCAYSPIINFKDHH